MAAAAYYADAHLAVGDHVAVYDLGGGTFDVAILRRTADGFELSGQPGGSPDVGGEHFDDLLARHLGATLGAVDADVWDKLQHDDSRPWRRHAADLRASAPCEGGPVDGDAAPRLRPGGGP